MNLRSLGIGALLLALCCSDAVAQETCRDAFIEGWFQETAEGDLEAALRLYRKAVELGGPEDRPIMAKAALRMARIARARGDSDAWRAQLEQLAEAYPGTEAAEAAAQELARPDEAGAGSSSAVEDARRDLIEMLLDQEKIATQKVRRVFRTLSVDEVMTVYHEEGGNLDPLPRHLGVDEFQDSLVDLLIRVKGLEVEGRVLANLRVLRESTIPQRLRDHLPKVSTARRTTVMRMLLSRTDPQGLLIFADLVSSDESYFGPSVISEAFDKILRDSRPEGRTAIDAFLDVMVNTQRRSNVRWVPGSEVLCSSTPSAEQIRKRVSEFPTRMRERVAGSLNSVASDNVGRRQLLDSLSADHEPRVRQKAISVLLLSDDPAERTTGIERLLAEPGSVDPDHIRDWIQRGTQPVPIEEVLRLPPGDLREYGYTQLLRDPRRNPAEVVRYGLERGDPELITALFQPRYWQSSRLSIESGRVSIHRYPKLLDRVSEALREGLQSASDQTIGQSLVEAVAEHDDEVVRYNFVGGLLETAWQDRAFRGAPDRLARDSSARVRFRLAGYNLLPMLSPQTQVRMLLDPDPEVAAQALRYCRDGQALADAAVSVSEGRLAGFAGRALELRSQAAVRACYARLAVDSYLTVASLEFLSDREIGVVVEALDRSETYPNALSDKAVAILRTLPLPEHLQVMLSSGPRVKASLSQVREALHEDRAAVEEAFRSHRIEWVLGRMGGTRKETKSYWQGLGAQLARLDAEEELVDLLRSGEEKRFQVGSHGLLMIGRGESIVKAMWEVPFPERLVDAALALDQVTALMELGAAGRISPETIAKHAATRQRGDLIADLVAPEGDWPRRLAGPSSEQLSQAIDYLVAEGATERLIQVVRRYEAPAAVRALIQLQAFEQVLAGLTEWSRDSSRTATAELYRLTGIPETGSGSAPVWPGYLKEQEELIRRWRVALLP